MQEQLDTSSLNSLNIPVPAESIRYRIVSSHIAENVFMESGRQCAVDIIKALNLANVDAREFRDVLDYGCGCSRLLRFLIPFLPQACFRGCDIDNVAIEWSRKHLPDTEFTVVPHLPPTNYESEKFDFIYGLSVFSHLDLPRQILWLDELRRILRPNGVLLLTVQGSVAYNIVKDAISAKQRAYFDATGFLFLENICDKVLPDWYQTAIYKEKFGRLVFNSGFDILRYDPQGMTACQDLILLRKR